MRGDVMYAALIAVLLFAGCSDAWGTASFGLHGVCDGELPTNAGVVVTPVMDTDVYEPTFARVPTAQDMHQLAVTSNVDGTELTLLAEQPFDGVVVTLRIGTNATAASFTLRAVTGGLAGDPSSCVTWSDADRR
jgi:hypothetical protein